MDAWFAGFHPTVTAVVWIGYDTPRKLGDRETGGGLALPVWIDWMAHALKGVPTQEYGRAGRGDRRPAVAGCTSEYADGAGVQSLGLEDEGAGRSQRRRAQQHPRPVQALMSRLSRP
jgi:penicillin-binding protein 1A